MRTPKDLSGPRFNNLVVLHAAPTRKGKSMWSCQCDCGSVIEVPRCNIVTEQTKRCWQCRTKQLSAVNRKHGQAGTNDGSKKCSKVYGAWLHIKSRCFNPNIPYFWRYGGRGITMCDEWRNSFQAFRDYIGEAPSPKHSIDRYPNRDGNYEPGNVRWATQREQVVNRDRKVLCGGRLVKGSEAAEILSENIHNIYYWTSFYDADLKDISEFNRKVRAETGKRPNLSAHFPKRFDGFKHQRRAKRVRLARAA